MSEKRFCSNCGQEVDIGDEFCFNCGSTIKKTNKSKKTKKTSSFNGKGNANDLNKNFDQFKDRLTERYNKNKKSIHIGVIALCLLLIVSVVAISLYDPYKEVGKDFLEDPVEGEKVQFEAVYVGETSYFMGGNHQVMKANDTYFYVRGIYLSSDDFGHRFLLKGTWDRTVTKHPFNGKDLYARWFFVEKYECLD